MILLVVSEPTQLPLETFNKKWTGPEQSDLINMTYVNDILDKSVFMCKWVPF